MVKLILEILIGFILILNISANDNSTLTQSRQKRQVQYCVTPDNYQGYCTTLTQCQYVAVLYAQNRGSNRVVQYLYGLRNACNNRVWGGDPVVCCAQNANGSGGGGGGGGLGPNTGIIPVTTPPPVIEPITTPSPDIPPEPNTLDKIESFQSCVTPNNLRGSCVTFTNCITMRDYYRQYGNTPQFQQFYSLSHNSCDNQYVRNDPVVCCDSQGSSQTQPTPATTTTKKPDQNQCRGPDGTNGNCISLRDCPDLLTRLQSNPNDEQFGQYIRDSNAVCGLPAPIVCCPSTSRTSTLRPPNGGGGNVKNVIITNRLPKPEDGCGTVANQLFKKVVGGQPAKPGDWPWIALLGYVDPDGTSAFRCGGSLITSKHILTAAHCIRSNLRFVRLGENDLARTDETEHMDINVEKTYTHPKYDRRDGHTDIAMLRLTTAAPFTNFIRFVCLPIDTTLRTKSYIDLNPFVAGWGKTQEGGKSAQVLQEIQIPVHRNEECVNRYRAEGRLISDKQFNDAVLCAGVLAGGKDTCQGDSGGPLVQPELNPKDKSKLNYYQIGVVSYGIGCARPNIPGVYTNIPKFIDWIETQIQDTSA